MSAIGLWGVGLSGAVGGGVAGGASSRAGVARTRRKLHTEAARKRALDGGRSSARRRCLRAAEGHKLLDSVDYAENFGALRASSGCIGLGPLSPCRSARKGHGG